MVDALHALVATLEPVLVAQRRDLHRHAESGWTEFRTASLVARRLTDLAYEVRVGRDVLVSEERMGVPDEALLERAWQRAVAQGGDAGYLPSLRGGHTAVVATLRQGPGPAVGLRFDMDALDVQEREDADHRPAREGFASVNRGVMHACGHDAHTAAGLAVAEVMQRLRDQWRGTLRLIFQPAEEGVRGAKAMVAAGVVDDLDYLIGHHVLSGWAVGELVPALDGYAATRKFDAHFGGEAAHAGSSPEWGRNALLAAATAVLGLYALPRHSGGATRVNVGTLQAGTARNVIASSARMAIETRGASDALSEYMYARAVEVLEAAAAMHGCTVDIRPMGAAQCAHCDAALAERVRRVASAMGDFCFLPAAATGGSEDLTYMMNRVQKRGGQATNIGVGADRQGISHTDSKGRERALRAHTSEFDIDEDALVVATELLARLAIDLMPAR